MPEFGNFDLCLSHGELSKSNTPSGSSQDVPTRVSLLHTPKSHALDSRSLPGQDKRGHIEQV